MPWEYNDLIPLDFKSEHDTPKNKYLIGKETEIPLFMDHAAECLIGSLDIDANNITPPEV